MDKPTFVITISEADAIRKFAKKETPVLLSVVASYVSDVPCAS